MAAKDLPKLPNKLFPFSPEIYPGRRPRFSFLFTSRFIYRCSLRNLDQLLEERHLPLIGERFAVLAYGSNACPSQLVRKCRREKSLAQVPVMFGRLIGAHAVYANRFTESGYVPATLARKKGSFPSWLTLLTAEQIEAMDRTEGRPGSYVLAGVPNLRFEIGQTQIAPLYSYVDIRGGVMVVRGRSVNLRSVGQTRAKALLELAARENAGTWLNFVEVPSPQPPQFPAQILRTTQRQKAKPFQQE